MPRKRSRRKSHYLCLFGGGKEGRKPNTIGVYFPIPLYAYVSNTWTVVGVSGNSLTIGPYAMLIPSSPGTYTYKDEEWRKLFVASSKTYLTPEPGNKRGDKHTPYPLQTYYLEGTLYPRLDDYLPPGAELSRPQVWTDNHGSWHPYVTHLGRLSGRKTQSVFTGEPTTALSANSTVLNWYHLADTAPVESPSVGPYKLIYYRNNQVYEDFSHNLYGPNEISFSPNSDHPFLQYNLLYRGGGTTFGDDLITEQRVSCEFSDMTVVVGDRGNVKITATIIYHATGRGVYAKEVLDFDDVTYERKVVFDLMGTPSKPQYIGWVDLLEDYPLEYSQLMFAIGRCTRQAVRVMGRNNELRFEARRQALNNIEELDSNWIENATGFQSPVAMFRPFVEMADEIARGRIRSALKMVSAAYLMWKYVIAPGVSDYQDVKDNAPNLWERYVEAHKVVEVRTGNVPVPDAQGKAEWRATYNMTLNPDFGSRTWRALCAFGLEPTASNFWDLVPYSFVIDWFLPIGDELRELERILQGTFMYSRIRHQDHFLYDEDVLYESPYFSLSALKYHYYKRTCFEGIGVTPDFSLEAGRDKGLSLSQYAQGTALIIQRLIK